MKLIRPIQPMGPWLDPTHPRYKVDARPGRLLVGEDVVDSIDVKVTFADIRWTMMPGRMAPSVKQAIIFIIYQGSRLDSGESLCLQQRPTSAELTGELICNARYRLSTTQHMKDGTRFYAVRAEEIRGTTPTTKAEWIVRYGGQDLLDREGFEVVPCESCDDRICHGWRVERRLR